MGTLRAPRKPAARRQSPPRTRASLAGLVVAALAFVVYLNALDNPFVYDDFFTVTANPSIARAADPRWTLSYMPFRPVVNVSYAIDRALWAYRPFGYHLTSLLLHAAVSSLLYMLLRRMLGDARRVRNPSSSGTVTPSENWAAFAGAALFATHPIQAETAGYVSSRSEILCALFMIAALLLARRARGGLAPDTGQAASSRRRIWAIGGAAACAVLAMLSKEVAAGLPLLFLAYDWWLLPGETAPKRRLALAFVPIVLLTVGAVLYRVGSLGGTDARVATTPLLNLFSQAIVIWRYLAMMLVPMGQAIMHETRAVTTLADPVALLAIAGLIGLAAAAVAARRWSPLYPMGAAWWFICIAPSSSVIALREGMAEHRVYVASAGVAIVITALAAQLARTASSPGRVPLSLKAGLIVLLALCSVLTIRRNVVWDTPVSVWEEARRFAPNMWEARYALRDAGDCPAALPEYQAVLVQQPRQREARTNLGICLGEVGRLDEAAESFREVIAIDPAWVRGYTNLAVVALQQGDMPRARDYYLQAIALDPRNVHARMQLARLYEESLHEYDRAATMSAEARAIAPSTPGVNECIARNEERVRTARGGA